MRKQFWLIATFLLGLSFATPAAQAQGTDVLLQQVAAQQQVLMQQQSVLIQQQMSQQSRVPDALYRMQFQAQGVATLSALGMPVPQAVSNGVTLQALALSDANLVGTFGLADVNAYRNQYGNFNPVIGQTVLEQQDNYAQNLALARQAYVRAHIKPWDPSTTNLTQGQWEASQTQLVSLPAYLQDDPLVPTYQKQAELDATGSR